MTAPTPEAAEVRAAYAAHDAAPTAETYARVCAAIRANTARCNPTELEVMS